MSERGNFSCQFSKIERVKRCQKMYFKLFFFVLSLNEKFLIDFNLIKIFFNESEDKFIKRVKTTDGLVGGESRRKVKIE